MGRSYVWVGGSSDSKSVDRFSWNVQENWLVKSSVPGGIVYVPADKIPGPLDDAYIGVYGGSAMTRSVTSPLLFGGCSASSTPFSTVWPYKNINGGISYATSTSSDIFSNTALSGLAIGDKAAYNYDPRGSKIISSYPFPVIGGGITFSVVELLKGCTVEGMTPTDWDSILSKRTTEQEKGLVLQVASVVINGDANHEEISRDYFYWFDRNNYQQWRPEDRPRYSSYCKPTPWNNYSETEDFKNKSLYNVLGVTGYVKHVYLKLLDTVYKTSNANATKINCNFFKNFVINLIDSNVTQFITESHTAAFIPSKTTQEEMTTDSRVKYVFENCNIDTIVWDNPYTTLVSGLSGGGRFQRASTFTAELKNTNFRNLKINNYSITTDEYQENTVSGLAWFRNEYNKTKDIPLKISGNISGISAFYKLYPKSSTLGISLTSKISVLNRNYGTPPILLLGPGITLDTLSLGSPDNSLSKATNTVLISPKANITEIITNFGSYTVASTDSPYWIPYVTDYQNRGTIDVFKFVLFDKSTLDMRSVNSFVKWRLGKISGTTLQGGLIMPPLVDNYVNLFMDSNTRLLNYVVDSGINKRTGNVYTETVDQRPGSVGIE